MLGMQLCRQDALKIFGLDINFIKGQNSAIFDEQGNRYTDALSQYGVLPFGHANEKIFAHCKQFFNSDRLTYIQPFTSDYVARLKQHICSRANNIFQHVILTTSGADTVETAIKMVRAKTGRQKILALNSAFHGKTCAALQLTDNPNIQDFFNIKKSFSEHFCLEDVTKLISRIETDKEVSSVFIELVQGEGGMHPLNSEVVRKIYEACKKAGVLFVIDEIQTGIGRTGSLFAYQQYGVEPDIMLLAKALGGGVVPIGACVAKDKAYPKAFDLYHSSTFANNNFTAYVADYILSQIDNSLLENVNHQAQYLEDQLQNLVHTYPHAFERVSGKGLMWGVYLRPWNCPDNYPLNHLNDTGAIGFLAAFWLVVVGKLITMPCYSNPFCLRVQPRLNCTTDDIDSIITALSQYGKQVETHSGYQSIIALNNRYKPITPSNPSLRPILSRHVSEPTHKDDFTFIIHPIDDTSIRENYPFPLTDNCDESREQFFTWLKKLFEASNPEPHFWYRTTMTLPEIDLKCSFYGMPLYPEQMLKLTGRELNAVVSKISGLVRDAKANTLGLGAYSSIIAKGGYTLRHLNAHGINVTAGSRMTAYSAFHIWQKNNSNTDKNTGILGPNGDIGKLIFAQLIYHTLVNKAYDKKVICFYNPDNKIARQQLSRSFVKILDYIISHKLPGYDDVVNQVHISLKVSPGNGFNEIQDIFERLSGQRIFEFYPSDDVAALNKVDSLFICTNFPGEMSTLRHLSDGASIYDVTLPSNVPASIAHSGKVTLHQAGLFKMPENRSLGVGNICGLPPGITLGCLTETILMSAAKKLFHFKPGWKQFEDFDELVALSKRFNFQPFSITKGVPHYECSVQTF